MLINYFLPHMDPDIDHELAIYFGLGEYRLPKNIFNSFMTEYGFEYKSVDLMHNYLLNKYFIEDNIYVSI